MTIRHSQAEVTCLDLITLRMIKPYYHKSRTRISTHRECSSRRGSPPRGRVLGSAVGACSGRPFYPLRVCGEGINGRSGPLKSQPSRAEGPTPPPRPCPHLSRKERAGWLLDGPSQFPARRGRGWA